MASFAGLTATVRLYQACPLAKSVPLEAPWLHQLLLLVILVQVAPPSSVRRIPPIAPLDPCKKAYTLLLLAGEAASEIRCQNEPPAEGVTSVQVPLFPTVAPAGDLRICPVPSPLITDA